MTNERYDLSRRGLLLGAPLAAAGLVAASSAHAKAPMQGTSPVNFRRVKIGGFEVTTVC